MRNNCSAERKSSITRGVCVCALRTLGAFLLLLHMAGPAFADLNRWMPYPPNSGNGGGGPWGGSVRRLLTLDPMNPARIWAATGGGVYLSLDGGATWSARNNGLSSLDLADLSISPTNPNVMIATSTKNGLYRTDDYGDNWRRLPDPIVSYQPQTWLGPVAIDPDNPQHIVLATFDFANPNYIFESKDGGQTWGTTIPPSEYKVTLGSSMATRIIFTTNNPALQKQDILVTLSNGEIRKYNNSVGSPVVLNRLYPFYELGSSRKAVPQDIYLPKGTIEQVVVAAGSAGVKYSLDSGTTWSTFGRTNTGCFSTLLATSVTGDPVAPSRILMSFYEEARCENAQVYTGVYETNDLFATAPLPLQMPEEGLRIGAMLTTSDIDLAGEVSAGIYVKPRGQGTYVFNSAGMRAFQVADFDFAPSGSGSTAGEHALAVSGGVFKQSGGNSGINFWDPANTAWVRKSGNGSRTGQTRLIKYQTDTTLWASVENWSIYRTTDSGGTWQKTGLDEIDATTNSILGLLFGPNSEDMLLAGSGSLRHTSAPFTDKYAWVYESGLTQGSYLLDYDRYLSPPGYYAASIVTGANAGVYHTSGFAQTWSRVDGTYFSSKNIASFAASSNVQGHLYAGTAYYGLHESFNGGRDWTPVYTEGIPINGRFEHVTFGNQDNDNLAAVYRFDDAIYLTGDAGVTWHRMTDGLELSDLTIPEVYSLHFSPDGKALIAAVDGMGLSYIEFGSPPVMVNPGNHSIFAQRPFTIKLSAIDPDGQPVTYGIEDPPEGAVMAGDTFSWTPTAAQVGQHWITFTVTDGFYTKKNASIVTVKAPNSPPSIQPLQDRSVNVGTTLAITIAATDADGQQLTYSANPMPAGASLTGNKFSWTPLAFEAGVSQITFLAFDGVEYSSAACNITVNTPPTLSPVGDGSGVVQAVVNSVLNIVLKGTDPDQGDTITYLANGIELPGSTYTLTPTNTDPITVDFTVRDSRGAVSNTVRVQIVVNPDPSTILAPAFTYIPEQTVNVGETLHLTISASQANGLPFTITSTALPAQASFDPGTGEFSWTALADIGQTSASFSATVEGHPDKTSSMTIGITTNAFPTIDPVEDVVGLVGGVAPATVVITAHDPNDTITFYASGLPPWASIDGTSGQITWEVHQLTQRIFDATVYAVDSKGAETSVPVRFITNNAPSIAPIGEKIVTVGKPIAFTVLAQDIDQDQLSLSVQGLPSGASFNLETGAFNWTPSTTSGSPHTITITATDSYGATFTASATVRVNPVPTPPSSGGGGGGGGCFLNILGGR